MKVILCITLLALICCQKSKQEARGKAFLDCIKKHENLSDNLKKVFSEKPDIKLNEFLPKVTFEDRDVLVKCRNEVFSNPAKDKQLRELLKTIIVKLPKKIITRPTKYIQLPKKKYVMLPKKIIIT